MLSQDLVQLSSGSLNDFLGGLVDQLDDHGEEEEGGALVEALVMMTAAV